MWFFEGFVPDFGGFSEQMWFFEGFVPNFGGFSEQSDVFDVFRVFPADASKGFVGL